MVFQSLIGPVFTLTTVCVAGALTLAIYIVSMPLAAFLLGLRKQRRAFLPRADLDTRFLILVPAHNEAEHLLPTLRSLMRLDYPRELFQVTVIADNCTDNTAQIAQQEGCEVWKRSDAARCGKGHALEWALAQSLIASFDAVVIIDADTRVSSNLLKAFAGEIQSQRIPLQARVDFEFPADSPHWLSLASTATQRAEEKYVTASRSQMRLYQGLQGTGFCIPVRILQFVPWSANSICEDLEYGFQLAAKGIAIRFVQDASVTSFMTGRLNYASKQRERWARGTYGLIAKLLPFQILHGIRRADWRSFEAAFYLMTRSRLPLAFLTAISSICLLILGHYASRALWLSLGLAFVLEFSYAVAILSILRPQYSRSRLLFGFFRYSTWLLSRHLGALLTLRNSRWIRTERG